jgi:predicted DNA-binding protein with PD1-like motif
MNDGEVYLHIHAVFGRNDCSCIGGHLLDATISGACELFIEDLGVKAGRKYDEETGLNLYEF